MKENEFIKYKMLEILNACDFHHNMINYIADQNKE